MKTLIITLAIVLVNSLSFGQEGKYNSADLPPYGSNNLNFVRLNFVPLLSGNIALEYERGLNKKIAVGTAISWRPSSGLPYRSVITDIVDDTDVNVFLDGMKTSSRAITPEVRFYLSRKGYGNGFYVAPYLKLAKFDFAVPYAFDVSLNYQGQEYYSRNETIELGGDLSTFSVGLSAGFNFKLAKNIHLDWRIIGPGYGQSRGNLSGRMALNAEEQDGLRQQLEDLQQSLQELPLPFDIDYNVSGQGADIKLNRSPWANIRSGLSLGFSF